MASQQHQQCKEFFIRCNPLYKKTTHTQKMKRNSKFYSSRCGCLVLLLLLLLLLLLADIHFCHYFLINFKEKIIFLNKLFLWFNLSFFLERKINLKGFFLFIMKFCFNIKFFIYFIF